MIALALVHRIIERVREREASEPAGRRPEWLRARAAAHVVLANRRSRLALYDLRESLKATAAPLPVEFLTALSQGKEYHAPEESGDHGWGRRGRGWGRDW